MTDGGGTVEPQVVAEGGKVTAPAELVKTGYNFGGWYSDEALAHAWDFDASTVGGATTLYAKWTPVDEGDDGDVPGDDDGNVPGDDEGDGTDAPGQGDGDKNDGADAPKAPAGSAKPAPQKGENVIPSTGDATQAGALVVSGALGAVLLVVSSKVRPGRD